MAPGKDEEDRHGDKRTTLTKIDLFKTIQKTQLVVDQVYMVLVVKVTSITRTSSFHHGLRNVLSVSNNITQVQPKAPEHFTLF